jgi:hypothetical protein
MPKLRRWRIMSSPTRWGRCGLRSTKPGFGWRILSQPLGRENALAFGHPDSAGNQRLDRRALRRRRGPPVSQRPLLRPETGAVPATRLVRGEATRGGHQPLQLCLQRSGEQAGSRRECCAHCGRRHRRSGRVECKLGSCICAHVRLWWGWQRRGC